MITPSDKTYQSTKQIILGKEEMNPDFKPLANFINTKFDVRVVNIIYDHIDSKGEPRLRICFEFDYEHRSFNANDVNEPIYNFDKKKQQIIAEKFGQLVDTKRYKAKNVWVIYSAFEPIAKIEANEKISKEELDKLQKQLNNKDIWTISRLFSGATIFLYTDEQLKFYENSPLKKEWADKYFEILNAYNEFGYFKRDTFDIFLDSKENFDKNYDSNWWYYYK
jgi:hypothetical protein